MRYLKTYEFFSFLKKDKPRMSAIEFLDWVIANYKTFEDNKKYYFFNVDTDKHTSVAYNSIDTGNYHVMLRYKDDKYQLIDFNGPDGKMGDMDPKTHKYKTWDTDITKEQYEQYVKEFETIDEYENIKDEEKHQKATPSVGEGGLNMKEDPLEQAGFIVSEHLSKYVGKSFKFDTDYIIWTSESTNNSRTKEIEETEFKIVEFKIGVYGSIEENDDKPKFYGNLITKWSVDGKEYGIMIEPEYKAEWVDLNNQSGRMEALRPHTTEKLTRRQEKQRRDDKNKYPYPSLITITPSKYDTIEMLKEFIEVIQNINDQVK